MTTTKTVTAEQVKAAAAKVAIKGEGRAYIYDTLVELIEGQGVWATGEELRAALLALHRAGQVRLSRCDMPALHDAEKVGPDGTAGSYQFIAV